ncbi:F-box/LRR-repeat protein At3g48880-like [Vitis riparia]|uniref:F-box/LRR-repeat protein At3g48880-like n=1 Tax=Vitis riparia TaxID=96939 RepID=UPI00155A5228|nr:F-box/LRR-repeat protein At3g48880-like [Vitis riparia]
MPSNYYIGETSSKRSNNGSKSDHSKMEGRKWEELNMDCLVNVFRRVGMESLLLDVPFVCKSWYKASLDPKCWEHLNFPKYIKPDGIWDTGPLGERLMMQYRESFSVTAFIKSVVARSQRHATLLRLPICCTKEALEYAANESPTLKTLDLDAVLLFKQSTIIPKLISKWKNLEMLTLGSRRNMVEILSQISLHCNNFIKLFAPGIYVGKDEVTAMITSLPNLKYLDLKGSTIEQKNLVMILQGCKELQLLDVRDCIGFWEGNAEILELASHIPKFMCEGSIYEEYDTYIDGDVDSDYYSG